MTYSSLTVQQNRAILFDDQLYLVDKRINRIIQSFLDDPLIPFKDTKEYFQIRVKGIKQLTQPAFEHVLSFFLTGRFSPKQKYQVNFNDLEAISCYYNLPLLRNYVYQMSHSKEEEDSFAEDSALAPFDKLEILALRQDVASFKKLFKEIVDKCSRSHSETLSGRDRQELGQIILGFLPEQFECFLCFFIRKQYPDLYDDFAACYARFYQYCLEDIIFTIRDQDLKWKMIAHLPRLETKFVWFSESNEDVSNTWVKNVLIQPLIEQRQEKEGLEWAKKGQNRERIVELEKKLKIDKKKEVREDNPLEEPFLTQVQNPMQFIQQLVSNQLHRLGEMESNQTFFLIFESLLIKRYGQGWTKDLLEAALHQHILEAFKSFLQEVKQVIKEERSTAPYEYSLHPAFSEDLGLIKQSIPAIKSFLIFHYGSEENQGLLKERRMLLSDKIIEDEVVSCARHLFQHECGLKTDFIIQSVCNYLQPYLFNQNSSSQMVHSHTKPFFEILEQRLQTANLISNLTEHDLILIGKIYIRQGVEMVNTLKFPSGKKKLFPYTKSHVPHLLGIAEALKKAFQTDLSAPYLQLLSEKNKQLFSGAELKREVFLQAIKMHNRLNKPFNF